MFHVRLNWKPKNLHCRDCHDTKATANQGLNSAVSCAQKLMEWGFLQANLTNLSRCWVLSIIWSKLGCFSFLLKKKKAKRQWTFKPVNFSWFFTSLSVQNFWFCLIRKCVKVKKPQWKRNVVLAGVLDQRVYFCLSGSLYYIFNNFLVKHNLMSFLYKIKVVQLFTLRFFSK